MTEKQRVGALSLFALGVNGIVGVGIFFTPNLVATLVPGPRGALVYLATAALLLPVALCFAALGRAFALDGGPYVWAKAAFGERAAFLVGWLTAVSAVLSTAAVFAGLRDHLAPLLHVPGGALRAAFAATCLLAFGAIAALGLRPSAYTWDLLTIAKLLPLAALVLAVLVVDTAALSPASSGASLDWRRALLIAVFPLQGFEVVPVLSGSALRAERSVPRATVGSLLFAAVLYAAIQHACVRALPDLATREMPLVASGEALGGNALGAVIALGTNVSALGTAFAMIIMTPRYLAVLGTRDGLGAWLGTYDGKGVPRAALALVLVLVAMLFSARGLASLLALSSAAVLVQYLFASVASIWLSWKGRLARPRATTVCALLAVFAIVLLAEAVAVVELAILAGALLLGGAILLIREWARRV